MRTAPASCRRPSRVGASCFRRDCDRDTKDRVRPGEAHSPPRSRGKIAASAFSPMSKEQGSVFIPLTAKLGASRHSVRQSERRLSARRMAHAILLPHSPRSLIAAATARPRGVIIWSPHLNSWMQPSFSKRPAARCWSVKTGWPAANHPR